MVRALITAVYKKDPVVWRRTPYVSNTRPDEDTRMRPSRNALHCTAQQSKSFVLILGHISYYDSGLRSQPHVPIETTTESAAQRQEKAPLDHLHSYRQQCAGFHTYAAKQELNANSWSSEIQQQCIGIPLAQSAANAVFKNIMSAVCSEGAEALTVRCLYTGISVTQKLLLTDVQHDGTRKKSVLTEYPLERSIPKSLASLVARCGGLNFGGAIANDWTQAGLRFRCKSGMCPDLRACEERNAEGKV